jgi:hypothetical protein
MSQPSLADFSGVLSLVNNLHFNSILGALVRHEVPGHLADAQKCN